MRSEIMPILMLLVLVGELTARSGVLMDWTKNETAGNADWVADHNAPLPLPNPPGSPTSWDGAYSTWAYSIYLRTGRRIRTLPPGRTITHGNAADSLDLSRFELFILPEPQNPLSAQEAQAVLDHLRSGGRAIFIANHNGSDRDGDGWDAPRVFNAAFQDSLGIRFHVTGDPDNSFSATSSSVDNAHPVISGAVGTVGAIAFHGGTVISLTGGAASVQGVVWHPNYAVGSPTGIMVACGTYGLGKFCAMGDSSPPDDGTGAPGDNLYDNWNELDNAVLLMNMTAWLLDLTTPVHERVSPPTIVFGPLVPRRGIVVRDLTGRKVRRVIRGKLYRVDTPEGKVWWLP